jgi:hypothetical protein
LITTLHVLDEHACVVAYCEILVRRQSGMLKAVTYYNLLTQAYLYAI